jgi:insulin-like growth factor-binding protein complex acid labile subunit
MKGEICMERNSIPTLIPPADASQPLLTPLVTIADNGDNKETNIGLRTFSRIPAADMTDQSVVLLPASGSIQADVIEPTENDDEKTAVEYQSLAANDEHAELYPFLESLGVTRQLIDQAQIPHAALWKLYQQEFSCFSWMKWSSLDHAIEKNLQWLLLSPTDVGLETPQKCDYRVRPHERTILLKTTWGLIKAYAMRGFVQGVEMGLLESVHYFIYAMLAYRLGELAKTGQSNFEEFQAIFSGSSQKGIDSLVRSLAELEARWLKLILVAPIILGGVQGILRIRGARPINKEEIKKTADKIQMHLERSGSFWRDVIMEEIPLLFSVWSVSSRVQKLEQWVRWDGRLDPENRQQAFELIRRVAKEGNKITQINALESLAKIAHGIGLKDLPRLRQAGYSPAELSGLLFIKATALADLIELFSPAVIKDHKAQSGKMKRYFTAAPRRLYAGYLLWWLGQSTSWWTQRLPFALLKIVKLGLEALFLQKIATSILEAIHCPDKPGFQFGNGYQDWASDYTAECFTARIDFFRTLDINESVAALVAEIPQYHLTALITLDLSSKYLNSTEALQIIQAVAQQGAPLQVLYLINNQISVLREGMFSGLSQLNSLYLYSNQISVLSEGLFSGLSQLTILELSENQINVLSESVFSGLSQLNYLYLYDNQISILSEGVFSALSQLYFLDLYSNQISVLSKGMFSGLSQLNSLYLYSNQISVLSEGMFSGLSQLTILELSDNQINILSEGVFSGLSQLIILDLYDNQISVLSEGVFSWLSQLTTLNLGGNQINVLSEGVFSGLSQLTNLNLGGNQINVLSEGVFSDLNQLQTLDLSINHLNTSAIISILSFLPMTLTKLDISLNQISTLPQNFSTLLPVGLKSLSIGGNRFIPRVLTQEFMQYFPFWLTNLELKFSLIVNITKGSFSDFSVLTNLDLRGNQIRVLNEGVFSGLSQLNDLDLSGNQIRGLSEGVFSGLSQLTTLYLDDNQIGILSDGVFSGLNQLNYLNLYGNQISVLSEGVFSALSQLTSLNLDDNKLNDTCIQNLTQNFPYQLNSLYLNSNQISNDGALALAKILPCTNLTFIDFTGNPANDTTLIIAAQQTALQKVCDDQRCHANLPATESCGVNINSPTTGQMIWELFGSVNKVDETKSDFSDYSDWSYPAETTSFPPALALPRTTSESSSPLLTTKTAGAMVLGMAGLSILLYKNSTWMQAIVNTGSRLFQRCWNNEKTETTSLAGSSDRRYTLFQQVSAFCSRKSSSFIKTTSVGIR